jgi:DNA polymerase-4
VRIRLVGIRVEGLQPRSAAVQQLALGEPAVGMREAEQAMDQLRRRFGPGAIRPARLVDLTDSEPPA